MCLIVDANRAAAVFQLPPLPEFEPLLEWLDGKHGLLVYGGKLALELTKLRVVRLRLEELKRGGRAHLVPPEPIEQAEDRIKGRCRSNDAHVLALALVSRARVVCTEDLDLIADFRDPALVSRPRGHVYQNESHARLLSGPKNGHSPGCPGTRTMRRR